MKRIFFSFLILLFMLSGNSLWAQKKGLNSIVLDAGHGGKDPGAMGTGRYSKAEKHLALEVVLRVGKYLEEAFPEMTIIYTRKKDEFLTLKERTDLANKSNADLFLSIHCDSFTKSSAKGSSSHVMGLRYTEANLRVAQKENSVIYLEDNYEENYDGFDPYSPESIIAFSLSQTTYLDQSILLAQKIQDQFRDRVNRVDRGVKQTPLWVTRATSMPSILVELGFISNYDEEDFLNSEQGQIYMSSAIYRAIKEYKAELESTISVIEMVNNQNHEKKVVFQNTDSNEKIIEKDVIFRVQFLTSMNLLNIPPINGHKVSVFSEDNVYKYTLANEPSFSKVKKIKNIAVENGYHDAFIVAFLNDKKISIYEALKHQNSK
ncbi:MAG: N-acetylmuramoyl-L-alanine amidase [Bacteroidota bacterium]|nr:N-acetylmuramoyl-L-alanine amidase [Bacteroidota bacterium]